MIKFELRHVIHDAIHGHVRLTSEEMSVVNHPLFARLHLIRQTSLLYYVWPGATHTRFAHSIGVLHMADLLLGGVVRNSKADAEKLHSFVEAGSGQAIRFHELEFRLPHVWDSLRRLARLTALVHDLGHGPLSHCFNVAPWKKDVRELLATDDRLFTIAELVEAYLAGSKGERVDHEVMSCILFAVICHDAKFEAWLAPSVAAVLLDRSVSEVKRELDGFADGLAPFIPFIRDLVSSAPCDADRMDYLHRDSVSAGVAYGAYDRERLLKSVLCIRDQGAQPAYRLGWRESGLHAVEHFVQARFQMYVQVYYHKTNHAIMVMLRELAKMVDANHLCIVDASSLDALIEDYGKLSDEMFLHDLAGDLTPEFPEDKHIRSLAKQILARRLWKRVYQFRPAEWAHADDFAEEMRKRHPGRRFILDRMPLKATKDLDRGAALLLRDANLMYVHPPNGQTWLEASPSLRALRSEDSIVRLFVTREGVSDPTAVCQLKKDALQLANEFPPFRRTDG